MAEHPGSTPEPQPPAQPQVARAPVHSQQSDGSPAPQDHQTQDQIKLGKPSEPENVLKEVSEKLQHAAAGLGDADKPFAQLATDLARQASDSARINNRSFQHELAYMVQDVEKARGARIGLSETARTEIDRLAGSAPGLENERLKELLRSTDAIEDKSLIREIRRAGKEIGQQTDQSIPSIANFVDNIANKVRLAPRANSAAPTFGTQMPPSSASEPPRQTDRNETPPGAASGRLQGEVSQQAQDHPSSIRGGPMGGDMNGIFRAMRGIGPVNTAPWEPGAQPLGARLSAFEGKMQQGRDDVALRGAEKSGHAAIAALEGFRAAEGAVVLNRIREAARSEPGGMASVLSEMREGGKFAELRQQFNNALSDERGASASYDRAASALASYGEVRRSVEQVIARRPDAANLSAKFEAMDKDIGAAAADIPSRRDGKSMIDDLSKQVADMLQKAFDGVKSFFTRGQSETVTAGSPRPN